MGVWREGTRGMWPLQAGLMWYVPRRGAPGRVVHALRHSRQLCGGSTGRRDHRAAAVVYLGSLTICAGIALDEWLDLRKWKLVTHRIVQPIPLSISIHTRTRASQGEVGQGCVDWPTGRALLQWVVDGGVPLRGAHVLEIGAGVGVASIGLVLAAQSSAELSAPMPSNESLQPTTVVATDVCTAALENLDRNRERNGAENLTVAFWDAAGGHDAIDRLPFDVGALTHVIGADLVSLPLGSAVTPTGSDDGCGHGLEATIAALLDRNPMVKVTFLLYNRVAGGAVSALANNAGISAGGCALDPAIVAFERRCTQHGLVAQREALPLSCAQHVAAAQPLHVRTQWFLGGVWDGLLLYHISRASSPKSAPSSNNGQAGEMNR
eukprot:scaffold55313_cov31-Tisochrysis_lutea.AAC.2